MTERFLSLFHSWAADGAMHVDGDDDEDDLVPSASSPGNPLSLMPLHWVAFPGVRS